MRQRLLFIAGAAGIALGGLFLLQGLGVVRWPASSFMIDQRIWITRGGAIALLGAVLIALASRRWQS